MSRVFISYSSKDRDFAVRLATDLRAAGHDVWLDRWRITGREAYWDEIQTGLEAAEYFIFCVSPDSLARASGARKELFHADSVEPGPVIIPCMIRSVPYDDFPIVISPGEYQIHDFVNQNYDVALGQVLVALSKDPAAAVTGPTTKIQPGARQRMVLGLGLGISALLLVGLLVFSNRASAPTVTATPSLSPTPAATLDIWDLNRTRRAVNKTATAVVGIQLTTDAILDATDTQEALDLTATVVTRTPTVATATPTATVTLTPSPTLDAASGARVVAPCTVSTTQTTIGIYLGAGRDRTTLGYLTSKAYTVVAQRLDATNQIWYELDLTAENLPTGWVALADVTVAGDCSTVPTR